MIVPSLFAWIEQSNHFASARINGGEIRTLTLIASVAGEGKVSKMVGAVVLNWDDMFNLMRYEWRVDLTKVAILTTVARSLSNGLTCHIRHLARTTVFKLLRAFACKIATTSRAST
jgi:hypothetical protein